jgi:hypothetical protein
VLQYFTDYCFWGTEYFINKNPIHIDIFCLVTDFSPKGYLFKEEGQFNYKIVKRGGWEAYPITFTYSRLLWREKSNIERRINALFGIPGIEKKLKGKKRKLNAQVGVLVNHPNPNKRGILLMTSENPYHWNLKSASYKEC